MQLKSSGLKHTQTKGTQMADLSTQLFSIEMPSPLILASGPRSYGAKGIQAAFDAGAGGVVTKTLRLRPAINPTPHIMPAPSRNLRNTLFNSEQWCDLPWEQWVETELPSLAGHPGALIASLGHTPQEVEAMVDQIVATGVVDILECVAYSSDDLAPMVEAIRRHTDLPLLAKLTFNWGERILEIAEGALEKGASGFTAMDSIGPTLAIDIETGQPMLSGIGGKAWMSGAAIKPITTALVARLALKFQVPIVGTGGVINAEDVVELLMAGANAVGVCTAPILQGMKWFSKTNDELCAWLDAHGYTSSQPIFQKAIHNLPLEDDTEGLDFRFDPTKCTLCGQCVVACSYDARQVIGETSRSPDISMLLDKQACRDCGLCVETCVTGALTSNWPR
jgi:dihydropyrimidine dehydrogenase (NAD+) subunit PreA